MAEYKNQHTVTKAYLRGFTADDSPNTLSRYDKDSGSCKQSSIESASIKFYAYSTCTPDGQWDHSVEHLLDRIESKALPILKKLNSAPSPTLSDDEKYDLALFIGVMLRRAATLIDHLTNDFVQFRNSPQRRQQFCDTYLQKYEGQLRAEQIENVRKAVLDGKFDISPDIAKAEQLAVWESSMPEYARALATMHWQIWKAERGHYFVTSDAPAFIRRHTHEEDPGVVAIADKDAVLTFPLSKTRLLIAKHSHVGGIKKATKTRVRELNSLIIRMTHKHVFAPNCTDAIKQLVLQNKDFSPPLPSFAWLNPRSHGTRPDAS